VRAVFCTRARWESFLPPPRCFLDVIITELGRVIYNNNKNIYFCCCGGGGVTAAETSLTYRNWVIAAAATDRQNRRASQPE